MIINSLRSDESIIADGISSGAYTRKRILYYCSRFMFVFDGSGLRGTFIAVWKFSFSLAHSLDNIDGISLRSRAELLERKN